MEPDHGLNTYYQDVAKMKASGFTEYSDFVKAIFGAVQKHADRANWLPVYWNIGDEPIGDNLMIIAELSNSAIILLSMRMDEIRLLAREIKVFTGSVSSGAAEVTAASQGTLPLVGNSRSDGCRPDVR